MEAACSLKKISGAINTSPDKQNIPRR